MNVLLTGASSGIGAGLLREFVGRGERVFTFSRRHPGPLPEGAVGTHHFHALDFSGEPADLEGPLASALAGLEVLDLVVLNAGTLGHFGDLADVSVAELERVMRVNVWANKVILDVVFRTVPVVRQVVAISSGAAVSGARGWSGYGISKAALNMLVALYAAERPGTHFAALAPGLVDTDMQEFLRSASLDTGRYPTVERLRAARNTDAMPTPDSVSARLIAGFEQVRALPSGSYADIRKL